MLKIVVIDDEKEYIEEICQITGQFFAQRQEEYRLFAFTEPEKFLQRLEAGENFDLFLLDVEMKEKNGLAVAAEIRRWCIEPVIIYVTNYPEYAPAAFEVSAFRYIIKKNLKEKLPQAYEYFCAAMEKAEKNYYKLETSSQTERIWHDDILYILKENKMVTFVLRSGRHIQERLALGDVCAALSSRDFFQIDRGVVVNLNHVINVSQRGCEMRDGTVLAVSRSRYKELRNQIRECWNREDQKSVWHNIGGNEKWL